MKRVLEVRRELPIQRVEPDAEILELTASGVACRLSGPDASKPDRTGYEIAIANTAAYPVVCRVYALDRRNGEILLGRLRVERESCSTSTFSIAPRVRTRPVFVRLTGDALDLRAQAPAIVRRTSRTTRFALGAIVLGSLAMSAFASAVLFGHPLARAQAAPLPVSAPPPIVVYVPQQPLPRPARVAYFTARREGNGATAAVLVSYLATGDRGRLQVFTDGGTLVGAGTFSHVGTTRVALAPGAARLPLRVQLDIERNGTHAGSQVELPAIPGAVAAAPAAVAPSAVSPAAARTEQPVAASVAAATPFRVVGRAIAGQAFTIAIDRYVPSMHLELQDRVGATIDESDVAPDAHVVSFTTPPSSGLVENYYILCTFMRAQGEESLIVPLRVYPR